jgi:hypothetical protein
MLASVLVSGTLGYVEQRSNVVGDEWLPMLDSREGDMMIVKTYKVRVAGGGLEIAYDAWFTRDPQNIRQHKPSPLLSHYWDRNPRYPDIVPINSDPPFRTIHGDRVRFLGLRGSRGGDGEGRGTHLVLIVPLAMHGL